MLVDKDFLTWLLIRLLHSHRPIKSQVWKFLITNRDMILIWKVISNLKYVENIMHIHVYAHMCEYLPRSFACIHGRGYRVHTCVYQAYATEVFMYCYWNLVHQILAVFKVGTMSLLAAPEAVVMTVSCATGAALSIYSNRRTQPSCGRYFLNILSCILYVC